MYTIRQILGTSLGLTMSGVKNMSNGPTSAPEAKENPFSGTKAYQKLKEVEKQMDTFVVARPAEAKALLEAARQRYQEISDNRAGKRELFTLMNKLAILMNANIVAPTTPNKLADKA